MIGAHYKDDHVCEFTVWAPLLKNISLKILTNPEKLIAMKKNGQGYWNVSVDGAVPGTDYVYCIEGNLDRPDPASFYQPLGVHGESRIIDHQRFQWDDADWNAPALSEMIMYELHIGTFTPEGTFDAAASRIGDLKDMGLNAIEIMPVAQFPGERNWGYDGVYPFAVQCSYGGPDGLKRFVNECHKKGMAVILDVVYNHLGPEGNYLRDFGPYFTDRYKTPWGQAVNFDGAYSNEVRNYFIENALYWFQHFHIDDLRLDAVHGIHDMSARHFLLELSERVNEYSEKEGRKVYLIAESDLNNSLLAKPKDRGGYGIGGLWCDDFHHSVHTLLTGEHEGYFVDFGEKEHLVKSLREGYVYSGQYSEFRKQNHGNSSKDIPADQFIVFSQNHDQVGNRKMGERLSTLVSFESQKLAAGIVLLSPYVPLLFMGEEYGETSPFYYFVSHSDTHLIEGIQEGRKKEFGSFGPGEEPPDPQDADTFTLSRLRWGRRGSEGHRVLLNLYRELISLRKSIPACANPDKSSMKVWADRGNVVFMKRWKDESQVLAIFNFNKSDAALTFDYGGMAWRKVLDSSDEQWNGQGTDLPEKVSHHENLVMRAESFALYTKDL